MLKVNKQSALIVKDEADEIVVTSIKRGKLPENGKEVFHVEFLHGNNKRESITIGVEGNEDLKKGTAMILQKEWSADSKFGSNISTSIVNVNRLMMSSQLSKALE